MGVMVILEIGGLISCFVIKIVFISITFVVWKASCQLWGGGGNENDANTLIFELHMDMTHSKKKHYVILCICVFIR